MDRRQFLLNSIALGSVAALGNSLTAAAASRRKSADALLDTGANELQDALQISHLTADLSVIMGAGGNIAVLKLNEGGPLQIDSGLANRSVDIAKAVTEVAGAPAGMLVNTHWHFDHTGGNEAIGKTHATIIAHSACRSRLSSDQMVEFLKMKCPASPEVALPIATFTDSFSIYTGGHEIALTHVQPAHTDTDIFVHFKKENVIHAGDLMFNGFFPFIDYSTYGWIGGMVAAADRILKIANADTRIIPGHGPIASRADLVAFRDMLHTVQTRLEKLIEVGHKPEQISSAKPLADLDAKWGGGFMKADAFTVCAAEGIVRHKSLKG